MNVGLGNTSCFGGFEKSEEMEDVGMDSAVRNKTKEMETTVAILSFVEGFDDVFLFGKFALLDSLINSNQVLCRVRQSIYTKGIPAKQLYQRQCSNVQLIVSACLRSDIPSELPINPSGNPTASP